MCYGSIDPKHGLRDLDRAIAARRETVAAKTDNREPTPGLSGWLAACMAWFRSKETRHG